MSEDPATSNAESTAAPEAVAAGSSAAKPSGSKAKADAGPGVGGMFFAIQKFVIERAWSLLLLTLLGEIGGFVIHKSWESVAQESGRTIIQIVLLVLGLIAFWISPKRAGFMRRLCFLLAFAGVVLAGLTWGFEIFGGRALELGHLEAVRTTWLGELGLTWLMFGFFLAVLMWGGRYVFSKWRETPGTAAKRAGRKWREDDSPHR